MTTSSQSTGGDDGPGRALLFRASGAAVVWAFGYASYRLYYAFGGTLGMLGTPVSVSEWRLINGIAGGLLLIAAVLPLVMRRAWEHRRAIGVLLSVSWIITVGCTMHAVVGIVERVLSLTGALVIDYPFWLVIDPRRADLQALVYNEPWFLIEGLLWAAMAWGGALRTSARRGWWIGSAAAAVVGLSVVALLSAFGVVGKWIIF